MSFKSILSAIIFGAAASLSAATAQTTSAVTAAELESALEAAGLTPTMTEDAATGAPVANATVGEIMFWVRAMDCGGSPAACENLVFFANFDLGRAVNATDYRVVNNFNDSQLFGRAYILERQNQVGVDYVVELGGGVSSEHLSQNVSRWADVIDAFVQKFSSGDTGA
ncbi:MAG: YbjN domain-containing protein [Pseudomonadota bacterium]